MTSIRNLQTVAPDTEEDLAKSFASAIEADLPAELPGHRPSMNEQRGSETFIKTLINGAEQRERTQPTAAPARSPSVVAHPKAAAPAAAPTPDRENLMARAVTRELDVLRTHQDALEEEAGLLKALEAAHDATITSINKLADDKIKEDQAHIENLRRQIANHEKHIEGLEQTRKESLEAAANKFEEDAAAHNRMIQVHNTAIEVLSTRPVKTTSSITASASFLKPAISDYIDQPKTPLEQLTDLTSSDEDEQTQAG